MSVLWRSLSCGVFLFGFLDWLRCVIAFDWGSCFSEASETAVRRSGDPKFTLALKYYVSLSGRMLNLLFRAYGHPQISPSRNPTKAW